MEKKTFNASELIKHGILEIGDGYRAKNSEMGKSGLPFARAGNIKDGFQFADADLLADENVLKAKNKVSRPGDVVFTSKGTVGRFALVKDDTEKFVYSPQICYWRVLDQSVINPEYLYYWMQSTEFMHQVYKVKGLTDMADYVSLTDQRKMDLILPEKNVQDNIASVLNAYDNLIENNKRRIAILEEMAQSLYREWFVKFRFPGHESAKFIDSPLGKIPDGWEVMAASAAIQINPRTKLPKEGEKPFVPMSGLNESSMVIGDIELKAGNSGAKFINDDTLFSRITPCLQNGKIGYVQFLDEEQPVGFGSTEFIVLRATEHVCPEYVYLMSRTSDFRENAIKSMTGATGRQRVSNSCFDSYMLAVPKKEAMEMFHDVVKGMFDEIFNLSKRNKNLRAQRDLLLPRLMGGKINIPE